MQPALHAFPEQPADTAEATSRAGLEQALSLIHIYIGENVSAARGRIEDTDFAAETANLTKNQVLQQAGTAILAQANQLPQSVLSLLR